VCETVWFFSWLNTNLKFVAFCPKFIGDSYVEFQEKSIPREFFRNFWQTKAIIYQNSWNFALISKILVWVRIALGKTLHVQLFNPQPLKTCVWIQVLSQGGDKPKAMLWRVDLWTAVVQHHEQEHWRRFAMECFTIVLSAKALLLGVVGVRWCWTVPLGALLTSLEGVLNSIVAAI